jgi:hypothetical protein
VEETAEERLQAQDIEIVSARQKDPDSGWIFAGVEADLRGVVRSDIVKAAVAFAEIEIVRIGLIRGSLVAVLDSVEALRLRHVQRVQDERIQYAENHGVRADGHC